MQHYYNLFTNVNHYKFNLYSTNILGPFSNGTYLNNIFQ